MPETPQTIGDLITLVAADKAAIAADQQVINDATAKLAVDQQQLAADDAALTASLAAKGGCYKVNIDTTATIYEYDSGSNTYHVRTLPSADAPIPSPPAVEPQPEPVA